MTGDLNIIMLQILNFVPPKTIRGTGVKIPRVFVALNSCMDLASLFPAKELFFDRSAEQRDNDLTEREFNIIERSAFFS